MSSAAEAISPRAEAINLEALLEPIPGENPAGENLQYSGLHDRVREARRADEVLEQGEWKRELKVANWSQVGLLAQDALCTKTKDLTLCAWLSEALVKLHGFIGLRDGLKLMRGPQERFWENLYPEIDEGDLEARANSLYWMDDRLALIIKEAPLTRSMTGPDHSYLQWEDARAFEIENPDQTGALESDRAEELKALAAEEGKITGEEWRKAYNATTRAFYEETYATVCECWEEFLALERVVDEKFDRQAPSLSALKKSIDDIRTLVEKLVKEKRLLEPDAPAVEESGAEVGGRTRQAEGASGAGSSTGPINSRQEALRRLAEVADYFHGTEPHSPVSYLVQRAIKWGEMPLELWLQDVIKDAAVLGHLRETLGINSGFDGGS